MKHLATYFFLVTALSFVLWVSESSQDVVSTDQYGWYDDSIDDSEGELEVKKLCSKSNSFLVQCVLIFNAPSLQELVPPAFAIHHREAFSLGSIQADEFLERNHNWTLYG